MLFLLVLNLELCKPATATSLSPNKEQKGRKKKVEQKTRKKLIRSRSHCSTLRQMLLKSVLPMYLLEN